MDKGCSVTFGGFNCCRFLIEKLRDPESTLGVVHVSLLDGVQVKVGLRRLQSVPDPDGQVQGPKGSG